ncbi:NUDIX hydrolase, partial [Candidatus Saccharibacteria bacterium]|nr:NUDIX hydrolase [Candidatus Saccharibacteria bacterium]
MTRYTLESSREWYNNLPGKRASAAMVIRYDGKILMVKDDYKPAMTFPGGNIDPNESAKVAAIRET